MSKENTFEKEFVPYQESLELKELDFDEVCLAHYVVSTQTMNKDKIYLRIGRLDYDDIYKKYKLENIPTFSQAFKWFREKYELVIEPCVPFQRLYSTEDDHFEILEFGYRIYSFDQFRGGLRDKIEWYGYDNSNEGEAELECLKKLIEIVNEKHTRTTNK